MYKVKIEKLRKALMFWRRLPEERFDFESVVSSYDVSGCGTVCCLIDALYYREFSKINKCIGNRF